jgi:multidrug efflux pump subunit AcrA (membrane-fusion protein)
MVHNTLETPAPENSRERSVETHSRPPQCSSVPAVGEQPVETQRAPHRPHRPARLAKSAKRAFSAVGPTLVLLGFGAVFLIGHRNDWRIPKFASLVGTASVEVDDWCSDHAVPASICVACDPQLMPPKKDFGWCTTHGVHNCVLDHPRLAELKQPPKPALLRADRHRAETALAAADRQENNSRCTLYRSRIQFASVESVRQAGVDIGLVERDRIIESVRGNGEVVYDPTRKASLAARVPGSVWSVEKNIGDSVRQGELLALIDATAVGQAKSDLLRSLAEEHLQQKNVARLRGARGAVAGSRILEAEAALAKARADVLNAEQAIRNLGLAIDADQLRGLSEEAVIDRLRLLGVPEAARSKLAPEVATANLLPLVAPMDGTVIGRSVSLGEVVDSSRELFQIADTGQMWLQLSLPLESVERLEVGQMIRFTPDGSDRMHEGKLDWISTGADPNTRMIDVRAVLDNRDGTLRDRTFGTGEVILRDTGDAIVVPSAATHWEGCCNIVFVRDKDYFASPESPKVFHVRSVRLGATDGDKTEVIAGVLPGEVVAVQGSDVLRAQLLKAGLGAGCCVEE